MKKGITLCLILAVMVICSGCETMKGLAQDIENTGHNIKEALSKND